MAAPIAAPVSAHLEQQLLETAQALFAQETEGLAADPQEITSRRVSITPNFAAGTVAISATLPIVASGDADGGMSFDVVEVLQ